MYVPEEALTLTKVEAAVRQTEAAIEAFKRGDFDIAVTLAGAAEDMLPEKNDNAFAVMRDSPGRPEPHSKKELISELNLRRDWLKHEGPPYTLVIGREDAASMIVRAISKLDRTEAMTAFLGWVYIHADEFWVQEP